MNDTQRYLAQTAPLKRVDRRNVVDVEVNWSWISRLVWACGLGLLAWLLVIGAWI